MSQILAELAGGRRKAGDVKAALRAAGFALTTINRYAAEMIDEDELVRTVESITVVWWSLPVSQGILTVSHISV